AVPPPPAPERRPEREDPGVVAEVLGSPVVKSFLRSAATALGREVTRGLFGTRTRRRR
ncbi:ATPase, partial [Pseudonocardia xinjiangensis]|nr:ATPase [Pseudonocardia xinjiangensis]